MYDRLLGYIQQPLISSPHFSNTRFLFLFAEINVDLIFKFSAWPWQCINMMVNHNEFGITEEEFEEHGDDETAVQELLLEKMRRFITRHPEVRVVCIHVCSMQVL